MKPIVGIVGNIITVEGGILLGVDRSYVNEDYINAIERLGATAVILPVVDDYESIKRQVDLCDGIILSGGQDIHPKFYNQELNKDISYVNCRVDEYQIEVTKEAINKNKSILGICRGHQLLNVVCGGSLYQDLGEYSNNVLKHLQNAKRYEVAHKIYVEEGSILSKLYGNEIWVNSYHHQAINEVGEGLKVTSKSSDGIIESIECIGKKFVMGVQWHPEMMLSNNNDMSELVSEFIRSCK